MIKKLLIFSFFILFLISGVFAQYNNASCKGFTNESVNILNENNYIPDGQYNSIRLAQGDEFDIYKPFYRSKKYMIVISCADVLPGLKVQIKNIQKEIIWESSQADKIQEFVFTPEKNQSLIISIKVVQSDEYSQNEKACVAVVVGFK